MEVETFDRTAVVFCVGFRDLTPISIRFGNEKVGGQGLSIASCVDQGIAYRAGL